MSCVMLATSGASAGRIATWGDNTYGQLGLGTVTPGAGGGVSAATIVSTAGLVDPVTSIFSLRQAFGLIEGGDMYTVGNHVDDGRNRTTTTEVDPRFRLCAKDVSNVCSQGDVSYPGSAHRESPHIHQN